MENFIQQNETGNIVVYTDGGYRLKSKVGGYGAHIIIGDTVINIKGALKDTTNNQMELTAVIKALEFLEGVSNKVTLYTDSEYVQKGITIWLKAWKSKQWKTSIGKVVKNIELWKKLDEIEKNFDIEWKWVKGHTGNNGNEKADELVNFAIDEYIEKLS